MEPLTAAVRERVQAVPASAPLTVRTGAAVLEDRMTAADLLERAAPAGH